MVYKKQESLGQDVHCENSNDSESLSSIKLIEIALKHQPQITKHTDLTELHHIVDSAVANAGVDNPGAAFESFNIIAKGINKQFGSTTIADLHKMICREKIPTIYNFVNKYFAKGNTETLTNILSIIFEHLDLDYRAYCPDFKNIPPIGTKITADLSLTTVELIISIDSLRTPDSKVRRGRAIAIANALSFIEENYLDINIGRPVKTLKDARLYMQAALLEISNKKINLRTREILLQKSISRLGKKGAELMDQIFVEAELLPVFGTVEVEIDFEV